MLVGREIELSVITSALNDAQAGRGSSVCFTGVPGEFTIGHAALADIVTPLRRWLSDIRQPQREALETSLG
jgi:hypothetical protein